MKAITTVGVVGAGVTGAAIARRFAQENFKVILADKDAGCMNQGLREIKNMLVAGIEQIVFTQRDVNHFLSHINGTTNLKELACCDLVIEAIHDDPDAKTRLFRTLEKIVRPDAILATSSATCQLTKLSCALSQPGRCIGLRFLYPTLRYPLLVLTTGEYTDARVMKRMKAFSSRSGYVSVVCTDQFEVIDRFVTVLMNEACSILDDGIANIATIDDVYKEVFGTDIGAFKLMNETGVFRVYQIANNLRNLGSGYATNKQLKRKAFTGEKWDLFGDVWEDEPTRKIVAERLLGMVFFTTATLLHDKRGDATTLNRGIKVALNWAKGPVELVRSYKGSYVNWLVSETAFVLQEAGPATLEKEFLKLQYVEIEKAGNVAVITINRLEYANKLNGEVIRQLEKRFTDANSDPDIETIYITGTGKSFAAGADMNFLVRNIRAQKIAHIENFTAYCQDVFRMIDESVKKVVALINGTAFGTGLELALCADMILALPGAQMAFPETGMGIYPGMGGTQRCARKIGKPLSKYLIHTGQVLSAEDALEIGLADRIINPDNMLALVTGEAEPPGKILIHLDKKWRNMEEFFSKNVITKVLAHEFAPVGIRKEDAEKIYKTLKRKAPVAINLADKLIEEGKGCDSELKYLDLILSTSDALLGLSSEGKLVAYTGD